MHPCDGQTDRRTDGRWHIARIAYMLSRAKKHENIKDIQQNQANNVTALIVNFF